MLPAKIYLSPRTPPPASPPPKLRPKRSSFRSWPYPFCLPREEEATASTADDPSPRISSKASPQLARWSRTRALRSGRRLERSNIRSKTSSPSSTSYVLDEISLEMEGVEEASAASPPADGKPIYMVSDGTGWTAEHSVNAALGQFEYCLVDRGCPVNTHLFSGITIDLETMHGVHLLSPFVVPMLHTNPSSAKVSHSKPRLLTAPEFGVLLQSCIDFRLIKQGRELHIRIRETGLERNPILLPKLLKFYSVCGQIGDAREVFDRIPQRNLDTFAYTAMITGYVMSEAAEQAIKLFCEMLELGLDLDSYTFSALLKASTKLSLHKLCTNLHSMILKCGLGSSLSILNALVHAYGSFGDTYSAHKVFDRMPDRDIVSWSSMIRACSSAKYFTQSAILFSKMQFEEFIRPNEITLVSVLPACSFFSSHRKGQSIHAYVIRNGFDSNIIMNSALLTMYSRCGNPDAAFMLFNNMEEKNVFVWTTMIDGFSINGKFELALKLFKHMQGCGLNPNSLTLIVVLSACSHGGLIKEGLKIFDTMKERFHINPGTEHYACIVDMLGRGGMLNEAENFIAEMDLPLTGSILGSLLGACQVHRNVELGEKLARKLFQLEPYNEINYVVLSNIYASVGRWDDVGRVRRLMAVKGLSKSSGCSWVEIKNKVYVFGAHDQSHSESESVYKKMAELNYLIVKEGYVPYTQCVFHDVDDDDKKRLLSSHSERLAIAFALLKAPSNVPIRIMKNLRVCVDCHDAIKLISKVVARDFIIRDTHMVRLIEIIKQAAKEDALVLYTLADPSMAESAKHACKLWGVPSTDILSPTIEAIAAHIGVAPSGIPRGAPGRSPLTEDYFKRIEAIDFTIKQDDGASPQNLNHAHIVLVGVSRTGKTPLSIYLAQKGYKVANIPIIMGVTLPKTLFEVDKEKIFGLTINPMVLQTIRMARAKTLGFKGDMMSNYSDMEHVKEELNFANRIFAQNPVWPVIEVTGKAIEESAALIVRIYHDRRKKCFLPRISKRY